MLTYPLIIMLGTWEIIAIVAVILLLFGGKKIPELMKGMGKGVRSFKEGLNEVDADIQEIKDDIQSDNYKKDEKQ